MIHAFASKAATATRALLKSAAGPSLTLAVGLTLLAAAPSGTGHAAQRPAAPGAGQTELQPPAPSTLPHWIGPLDVTDELAGAKARAYAGVRARTTALTLNQTAFDFHFYDLDLHPDPATWVLTASVRMLASVVAGPVTTLELDFNSSAMTVDGVTCAGLPRTFTHASDLLTVSLDRTYQTGEMVDVTVSYHGTPYIGAMGGAFTFQKHQGTPLITTLSEPFDARQWWPCKDDPSDKADSVDIRVTVPSGMITASNGTLVESTDNGTTAYRHWKCRHPIATYLVSIASYAYTTSSDWYTPTAGNPMEIQFYLFHEDVNSSAAVNAKVKTMIAAYAARFGEYPFLEEKYGEAEFTWGGGMENQTCTSLGTFSESVVAHELTHQWFGDAITCRDFHHIWLNEGFATYGEALWAEAQDGPAAYATSMAAKRYLGSGTIYVPDLSNVNRIFDTDLSYRKPSWVLHMLRHILGDATFFSALRSYLLQLGGSTGVTEDFQHVCESASGLDLGPFFQEWIYGEYYPQYQVGWWSTPAGGGYDVTLQLQQVQTWQRFWMPVDVRIQTASGPQNFVVNNSPLAFQSFTLHVAGAPTSLTIDPDNWILQTTSYPTGIAETTLPSGALELAPPRPNPARGPATLSFVTPREGRVRLAVVDAAGRHIALLLDRRIEPGTHSAVWDGREASGATARPGVYWISLDLDGERRSRRIAVVP